jgi:hypothetical protein
MRKMHIDKIKGRYEDINYDDTPLRRNNLYVHQFREERNEAIVRRRWRHRYLIGPVAVILSIPMAVIFYAIVLGRYLLRRVK